ncbi:MAG: hypothetical protein DI565_05430 [Ancylobacter novellus]|uniref:Uncharacterized protein n=1 Tax=Ancylobacter novellus TaxID=921 RepID=A0A2W5KQI2_ANCNO|nr:MAG: hypothetical protein DI565_05430 [Ancylobacter novellus]
MRAAMRASALATIAAFALGTSSPARALNEDVMRNVLSSILLAQNFTSVCVKVDPDFAAKTGGKGGDADTIIAHMKEEILATMTREEAAQIVVSAAGAARAVGLGMIRALSGGPIEEQESRLKELCDGTAKPLVKGVVETHEERHDFFEQMIEDARQG